MIEWIKCVDEMPQIMEEVLVWVDGKRSPSWSNNFALVAYLSTDYKFYEQQHISDWSLIGVVAWARINKPEF